ncbi:MAG: hypothetical protein ACLGSA_04400 [Acidobacteriota bacterium]
MNAEKTHFQPVYDQDKNILGIWISPQLWAKVESAVSDTFDKALEELSPQLKKEPAEPIKDWEMLAQYWDWQYPMPTDVHCEACGSQSPDWQKDEPRKFRLRSATLGGLVNFECLGCRSRIIKKHFKKHVDVECRPFLEK